MRCAPIPTGEQNLCVAHSGDSQPAAERARAKAVGDQRTSLYMAEEIARRFSTEEVELLRQRFAPLEASLDSDVEMPTDFGVDEFVTSWDQHQ